MIRRFVKQLTLSTCVNEGTNTIYYLLDLKHQAANIIKEALLDPDFKVYGAPTKRKTKKQKWLQHTTYGAFSPITVYIQLYNNCWILDYNRFDPNTEVTEEEGNAVVKEIERIDIAEPFAKTGRRLVESYLTTIPKLFKPDEYVDILYGAFRGGANYTKLGKFEYETHVDYHQLYASILKESTFPTGKPIIVEGCMPNNYAIYQLCGGRARLKPNGFPIIPVGSLGEGMFGADGKWHQLTELYSIADPDLYLLFENYDVEGLEICATMYWQQTFCGKDRFNEIVNLIYDGRQNNSGSIKRLYKLMNEYVAGIHEMTECGTNWWIDLTPPPKKNGRTELHDCSIGIFMTAFGRRKLNNLIHGFPYNRVIGYDTDCCFFAGIPAEVPESIKKMFGDLPGQLHYDGDYKQVTHEASKRYYGLNRVTNEPFWKMCGQTLQTWRWDRESQTYKQMEV